MSQFEIEGEDVVRQARILEERVKMLESGPLRSRRRFVPSLKRQRAINAERKQKKSRIGPKLPVEVVDLDQALDEAFRPLDGIIEIESSDEDEVVAVVEDDEYQETLRKIKINESLREGSPSVSLLDDESEDEIEILEERLAKRCAQNGGSRKLREPLVKQEVGDILENEVSRQDSSYSNLELHETIPPFQTIKYGPILNPSSPWKCSRKTIVDNSKEDTYVESESDEWWTESVILEERENLTRDQFDKTMMFRALGRSLGSFGGTRKVSFNVWFGQIFDHLVS